jgi:hypothetical protein
LYNNADVNMIFTLKKKKKKIKMFPTPTKKKICYLHNFYTTMLDVSSIFFKINKIGK